MLTKKEIIKEVVDMGCSLEYKQLTICKINDYYMNHAHGTQYQVHCEHSHALDKNGFPFSELYNDIDKAIDKFLQLKEVIYGYKH